MNQTDLIAFQRTVQEYYRQHGRHDLPWRRPLASGQFDPYHIVVSELMLQQTQVARVIPKYLDFIAVYPSFANVASAPLSDILKMWNGLGYNRRAKFLWELAGTVQADYDGCLPMTFEELVALPGIGANTAGAILAYAYNQPVIFIETNIRTVFIHHFFADQTVVSDALLLPLLRETLPERAPRLWYWALMDYGTYLKQTIGNLSRASTTYAKQSTFQGSRRQIRGQILRELTQQHMSLSRLEKIIPDERLMSVLTDLEQEGFIEVETSRYRLRA